jgi:hypothetical protein
LERELDDMRVQERSLDARLRRTQEQSQNRLMQVPQPFVLRSDIYNIPGLQGLLTLAIRPPPGTKLVVPDPSEGLPHGRPRFQIYLQNEQGQPIEAYIVSRREDIQDTQLPPTPQMPDLQPQVAMSASVASSIQHQRPAAQVHSRTTTPTPGQQQPTASHAIDQFASFVPPEAGGDAFTSTFMSPPSVPQSPLIATARAPLAERPVSPPRTPSANVSGLIPLRLDTSSENAEYDFNGVSDFYS